MDPRRLLPYLLALTLCVVLATAGLVVVSRRTGPAATEAAAGARATPFGPREVLADWDERRSRAWADGDPAALRDLYVAGSPTGRADVRMLAAYVDRGLRVEGLSTQVLALEVLDEAPDELTVRVTDRVVGGVVRGESLSQVLPHDRASTRTLVLRRVDGVWLVGRVRDRTGGQDRAAARTSRTSTSWKS